RGDSSPAPHVQASARYLVSTAPSEAADPDPGSSAAANAPKRRLVRIDVTGGAVTKIVIGLLALGVVGHLFEQMRDLFVWTLTATFLAIALNPLVERLQPRIGRKSASTIVVIGFALAFLGILVALIAPFVTQV